MGPRINENRSNKNSDEHRAEDVDDGWRMGFDVRMEGVGTVNINNLEHELDESDADDSNNSFYSDDSENEAKRAGYRPLMTEISEPSVEESMRESNVNALNEHLVPKIPSLPSLPHSNKFEMHISHKPLEIFLNKDKIDEIKSTMSKITIPPPAWANAIEDKKLMELVRELRRKE